MRIALDAKRILNNATGLGNHGRILLHALLRDYPVHDYLLYSPQANDAMLQELSGDFQIHFPEGKLAKSFPSIWRSLGITSQLKNDRVEIYHGISNELPFNIHDTSTRKVVTIHDLIFLKHKDQYPFIDRQIYEWKTRYAAQNAHHIIAVSTETKEDLINFYKVPEQRITVVYPAIDQRFYKYYTAAESQTIKERYQLPENYLLNVGSFFTRKNQLKLIEAFNIIKDKIESDLVLAGTGGNQIAGVRALIAHRNLQKRVHIVSTINNDDMPALYQSAQLFVFPSLMEGFGAPIVEAMVSGTPLLVSAIPCFKEVGANAVGYFNPNDAHEMADSILALLQNDKLRHERVEVGRERAKLFSDSNFAEGVMKVYEG